MTNAAMQACLALMEALDPDRSAAECRKLMVDAIEAAMHATGHELRGNPVAAADMFAHLCETIREAQP